MNESILSGPFNKYKKRGELIEVLESTTKEKNDNVSSIEVPYKLELKQLPVHLQYAYLEVGQRFPIIIATNLLRNRGVNS